MPSFSEPMENIDVHSIYVLMANCSTLWFCASVGETNWYVSNPTSSAELILGLDYVGIGLMPHFVHFRLCGSLLFLSLAVMSSQPPLTTDSNDKVDRWQASEVEAQADEREQPLLSFVESEEERRLVRKLDLRILPITCLLYMFACMCSFSNCYLCTRINKLCSS